MILLTEPTLLSKKNPTFCCSLFIEQWDNIKTQKEDISIQLLKAMKTWIQEGKDPTLTKKTNCFSRKRFAEQNKKVLTDLKPTYLMKDEYSRINLEG